MGSHCWGWGGGLALAQLLWASRPPSAEGGGVGTEDESHHPVPGGVPGLVKDWPLTGAQWPPHSCPHPGPEHNPRLTTPSSAGALSPTTSITGQLRTEGKGCPAWARLGKAGGRWGQQGQAGGEGRSPEGPGIRRRPRPVNVQVPAAVGEREAEWSLQDRMGVSPSLPHPTPPPN